MKHVGITGSYNRFYPALNFDRAGLFELIKDKYGCGTVLYPGCSIHITPSFYFQHVVYVDISETAKEFFKDNQNILSIVNSNKKYKQSAYIQFIHYDYTKELPVRENNYDLLLSIYAGCITKSCKKYIKRGGIIVSNNHHNDAQEAIEDSSVTLEALIRKKGRRYQIEEKTEEMLLKTLKAYTMPLKNMRRSNCGMEYVDNECYFVLRKTH
ncbi:MAG: class I SAM-dependent methyltransferase [Desulfotomaculaceae bacterium]|nr:class I SAM-dependent methyltransferase [Desulfotomaculaceae bacterium]